MASSFLDRLKVVWKHNLFWKVVIWLYRIHKGYEWKTQWNEAFAGCEDQWGLQGSTPECLAHTQGQGVGRAQVIQNRERERGGGVGTIRKSSKIESEMIGLLVTWIPSTLSLGPVCLLGAQVESTRRLLVFCVSSWAQTPALLLALHHMAPL